MASTAALRPARLRLAIAAWASTWAACAGVPREAAAPCRFFAAKTSLEAVTVSVPGQRFSVGLKAATARIEMPEGHPDARLQISAPLRFSATVPKGHLPLRVAVGTDLYGGRIRLGEGAAPAWREVHGDSIRLSLEPMLGVAVEQPLAVECSRLELSDGELSPLPEPDLPGGDLIGLGWASFPLYLAPEERDPLDIHYRGAFQIVELRPGWMHLVATWEDGSQLEGWTPERQTTPLYEAFAGVRQGRWGDVPSRSTDGPERIKVTLRAGAAVAASAAGPVWATAARDLEVDAIAPNGLGGSDEWLQIASVPGVPWAPDASQLEHLWVRANDVSLSAMPPPPPS
jgi:hypothetical protein